MTSDPDRSASITPYKPHEKDEYLSDSLSSPSDDNDTVELGMHSDSRREEGTNRISQEQVELENQRNLEEDNVLIVKQTTEIQKQKELANEESSNHPNSKHCHCCCMYHSEHRCRCRYFSASSSPSSASDSECSQCETCQSENKQKSNGNGGLARTQKNPKPKRSRKREHSSSSSSSANSSSGSTSSSSSSSSSDSESSSSKSSGSNKPTSKKKLKKSDVPAMVTVSQDSSGVGTSHAHDSSLTPSQSSLLKLKSVVEWLCERFGGKNDDKTMQQLFNQKFNAVNNAIKGVRLQALHSKSPVDFIADGLSELGAGTLKMTPKAPAYLTVAAHYAKKGMTLQHPDWPCCIKRGGGEHLSYFPLELMYVVPKTGSK